MAEIINLRRQRKRVQREQAEKAAAENRTKAGLSKHQHRLDRAQKDKAGRDLEQHKLAPGGDE